MRKHEDAPGVGGGLEGVEAGQDSRAPQLQLVDAHQHVAVAGQRASIAVVDLYCAHKTKHMVFSQAG